MSVNNIKFSGVNIEEIEKWPGKIVVFWKEQERMSAIQKKLDSLMNGTLTKLMKSSEFGQLRSATGLEILFPLALSAKSVNVIKLSKNARTTQAKMAGGFIASKIVTDQLLVLAEERNDINEILLGYFLRSYRFNKHKTGNSKKTPRILVMHARTAKIESDFKRIDALIKGVFFTRDLTNEPANILTTEAFSTRLTELKKIGVSVKVLNENEISKIGMRTFLGVGSGSINPSKVVILSWNGNKTDAAPLLLVGKGVVFDSGGISLKPAGGMEEMVMDMGGAAVVAGVFKTIALRKSTSNVIGLIGLVENMPSGSAQRPGDVITSLKGDTIEVINTDAEGRLVLCDLLWYGQEYFSPCAIIDLATLTGAIVVALGEENAGVFSNDDVICNKFLNSAKIQGEGAWRMPLNKSYDKLLESRVADISNVGGRAGSSIIAAKFLQKFVKRHIPWIHLDIAGVASKKHSSNLSPKGATGWGVLTLDHFIQMNFENK